MLFDRFLDADLADDQFESLDSVEVEWHECNARALRKTTARGENVGLLIPVGATLHDGDLLATSDGFALRIVVPPCEVWVVQSRDAQTLSNVALELGNLHVPVEADETGLIVYPDGPTREVLDRYRCSYRKAIRVFSPLRATVLQGVKLAEGFSIKKA